MITIILPRLRNAFVTKTYGHFSQRPIGNNTIATHKRSDSKQAVEKFRAAQQAAIARGETVTKSVPRHERARQREAHNSNAFGTGKPGAGLVDQKHSQQTQPQQESPKRESQITQIGSDLSRADAWNDSSWWSSSSSSEWWQRRLSWHAS